jgi:hypothetical protein
MAYDTSDFKVVLFGGLNATGALDHTFVWDDANWTQEDPAHSPPKRYLASMAYDAADGKVVLFGGGNSTANLDATLSDTWVWNGTDWKEEHPAKSPSGRGYAGMAYDAADGKVVLFGGALLAPSPGPSPIHGCGTGPTGNRNTRPKARPRAPSTPWPTMRLPARWFCSGGPLPPAPFPIHGCGTGPTGNRNTRPTVRPRVTALPWPTTKRKARWFCSEGWIPPATCSPIHGCGTGPTGHRNTLSTVRSRVSAPAWPP